jgi:amidohydrolase
LQRKTGVLMARALWALLVLFAIPVFGADRSLNQRADHELGNLVQIYEGIHAAPELSHHEEQTSALLAKELRAAGYTVTEHVGKYRDAGLRGYGVVAVMKNGSGPTILVRADMDALPVEEKTGAPYASHVKAPDDSATGVPVMHACGHDIHTTVLIGTARMLAALRSQWHGTLVLVGQPSE